MGRKVKKISEKELSELVHNLNKYNLNEIDGKTYSRINNTTIKAQQNRLNGGSTTNGKRDNLSIITKGIELEPLAANSLIEPYKKVYMFHGQNLRKNAAILLFQLDELSKLDAEKTILKGKIVFYNETLSGSIIVDLNNNLVYYNYKGRKPKYMLVIDPECEYLWNKLLNELKISVNNMINEKIINIDVNSKQKKFLYESIMKSVAKTVQKKLNETKNVNTDVDKREKQAIKKIKKIM